LAWSREIPQLLPSVLPQLPQSNLHFDWTGEVFVCLAVGVEPTDGDGGDAWGQVPGAVVGEGAASIEGASWAVVGGAGRWRCPDEERRRQRRCRAG